MKRILVVGAGLSASSLIQYLLEKSENKNWHVTVADFDVDLAVQKVNGHTNASALKFDVFDIEQRQDAIREADIVVSMLPAHMHIMLAEDCVIQGVNMVTASYVSDEMKALNESANSKGVLLLNEIGLDPGIDHLSAKKIIDEIHAKGGKINLFKSFCGGLVAPEYDNNPWNYKFTWNPRNVVLAGKGTAQFKRNNKYKYIPYTKLFNRTELVEVLDEGQFEAYANRDSLSYRTPYGLDDIPTMFRGTLRKKGFCKAWNVLIQLGMTDDTFEMEGLENKSWRDFTNSFLMFDKVISVEDKLKSYLSVENDTIAKLDWLGLFSNDKIDLEKGSPAQVLQHLLEKKWALDEDDKDMIVMQHIFEYDLNGNHHSLKSSLVFRGKDQTNTAMSMTVGLPMAIATELILDGKINMVGVKIPIYPQIYLPVLEKLKEFDIDFIEELS
ncbi:MAG: saccharopine dehydrogenase C-terminal domain-containing protein [Flavobacteriales bacterium]